MRLLADAVTPVRLAGPAGLLGADALRLRPLQHRQRSGPQAGDRSTRRIRWFSSPWWRTHFLSRWTANR